MPSPAATTTWTTTEVERIGDTEELELASRRADGTLRRYVTMWVVRVGDDLYVRSAYGPDNTWFARAKASGTGRIRAGGVERDVSFGEARADVHVGIDAAYRAKYGRYGPAVVGHVIGPDAYALTICLLPIEAGRQSGAVRPSTEDSQTQRNPQ
jgi:hypothetical protein